MNEKEIKVLFSCGDRSADKYLSLLLKNIKQINSHIKTYVLGGDESKSYSDVFLENLVDYDAHGFYSPFFQFFKFFFLLKKLKKFIKNNKIILIGLIDYYGFNIRVAKLAKRYNIKVVYYITPQVWANRRYRLKKIKKYVDFVINIYPFEKEIYDKFNIKNFYFGHPIVDIIQDQDFSYYNQNSLIIGIFPGSRKQVIKWNLPIMLDILNNYFKSYNMSLECIIFGFKKYENLYKKIIRKYPFSKNIQLSFHNKEELRKKISLAISVSGTVVLENVFYGIPTIVIYRLPYLMYFIVKKIVYVKFISIPNIILNKEVIPEFIQNNIKLDKISKFIHLFLHNTSYINNLLNEYSKIKLILSENKNVSFFVAKKIIEYIYEQN
ncbi:MAG: hypothetical protein RMJ67_02170 [Elusimicrobiota bacterium]|nr:hypothetical protein [Endomicrobiia bacterium]MCX7911134.1 hypothetical protein [Endomicrobiia bacterium]MDW8165307.1 hypothetical protein [Elusimicrobiota bacterium]